MWNSYNIKINFIINIIMQLQLYKIEKDMCKFHKEQARAKPNQTQFLWQLE